MKKRYWFLILTSLLSGIYLSVIYINPYHGTILFSEAILQLSGSRGNLPLGFSYNELLSFAMRLFPSFIFELYVGIMLYQHFCTASVYVFSRYPHRIKWYMKEALRVWGMVCIFYALLLAATLLTAVFRYKVQIDPAGILLIVYHFCIYSLWTYSMTLAINLISLYIGSSNAYVWVISIQLIGIALLNLIEWFLRRSGEAASYQSFLVWNPFAHLVIGWHSGNTATLSQVLTSANMNVNLNASLILFLFLGTVVTITGALIVKNHDLLVSNSETEVA